MSVVDNFIAALHSSGAERLLLASGRPAVLTVDGDLEPVPGEALDRPSLEGMILVMGGTTETGQHEFVYEAPTGRVNVTARITDRLIQAIILPAVPEEAGSEEVEEAMGFADDAPIADGGGPAHGPASSTRTDRPVEPDPGPSGSAGEEPLPGGALPETEASEPGQPSPVEDAPETETASADPDAHEPARGGFDHTYAFGVSPVALENGPETDVTRQDPGFDEARPSEPPEAAESPSSRSPVELDDSTAAGPGGEREPPPVTTQDSPPPDIGGDVVLEVREDAPAMERLFLKMVEHGCSDLHVSAGNPPLFRKDGRITDLGAEPRLSPTQAKSLLTGITPEKNRKEFEERNDTDFAYEIPSVARFRCNLFRDRNGMGGVFRQIPTEILTAEQLGLPGPLLDLCALKKGLILVTGPTGSGKSTTLAALIDHINRTRQDHIITIEDPIEFVHRNRQCLINQREVGEHTRSFKVALRAALREDPDIVLVGELRDLETVEIALETAETGHLVFGTLHTNTAPGTVSRLIDQFPSGQQAQIRTMLADTLKAVVAQTLCRKTGGGRVAALETLVVTTAVANLIREDKAYQISSAMQTGRAQGMKTLNDALLELVKNEVVTAEEAHVNAVDKSEFINVLSRNGIELEKPSRVA